MHRVLSVGGSESSGSAGLAVDLRVFAAHGVHGCLAVSAVTAQPDGGSLGVGPKLLRSQIETAGPLDAAKIGLLLSSAQASVLAELLAPIPTVFDPVQRSSQGRDLAEPSEWKRLVERLLPAVDLFTPNLEEAALLLGRSVEPSDAGMEAAGRDILRMGPKAVLVKGGHRDDVALDLLVHPSAVERFESERLPAEFRGTGCLLSASVAALLARGRELSAAVGEAKRFVDEALRAASEAGVRQPHVFFEYYGAEGLPSRA